MVQQVMGDGIGIPPCDTEEQKKLQNLHIGKLVQPFRQESLLESFSVSVVN